MSKNGQKLGKGSSRSDLTAAQNVANSEVVLFGSVVGEKSLKWIPDSRLSERRGQDTANQHVQFEPQPTEFLSPEKRHVMKVCRNPPCVIGTLNSTDISEIGIQWWYRSLMCCRSQYVTRLPRKYSRRRSFC